MKKKDNAAKKDDKRGTEAKVFGPYVHELRAQLALVRDDEADCERERDEAARLFAHLLSPGHIERMDRELGELRSR